MHVKYIPKCTFLHKIFFITYTQQTRQDTRYDTDYTDIRTDKKIYIKNES